MGPARNVGRSLQTELYAHLSLSAHVGRTSSKQVTVPDTHAGQESYASPWQEEAGDIQRPRGTACLCPVPERSVDRGLRATQSPPSGCKSACRPPPEAPRPWIKPGADIRVHSSPSCTTVTSPVNLSPFLPASSAVLTPIKQDCPGRLRVSLDLPPTSAPKISPDSRRGGDGADGRRATARLLLLLPPAVGGALDLIVPPPQLSSAGAAASSQSQPRRNLFITAHSCDPRVKRNYS